MTATRAKDRGHKVAAVCLIAALALGGSIELASAKPSGQRQAATNDDPANGVASQRPKLPSNHKPQLVPSFSGEQVRVQLARLGALASQLKQQNTINLATNSSQINGTGNRTELASGNMPKSSQLRIGSDLDQAASSLELQISRSFEQQPLMLVAQTRHSKATVALPRESLASEESDEFGPEEQEESEERAAPRAGSLRPALIPTRGRLATASSRHFDEQLDERQSGHEKRRGHEKPEERTDAGNQQDAVEASEAELADKSALDEQQQAQREIILAQAQSEAKAIKDQQEALMKQQALQQQMILRRQSDLERAARGEPKGRQPTSGSSKRRNNKRQQESLDEEQDDDRGKRRSAGDQSRAGRAKKHFRSKQAPHGDDEQLVGGSSRQATLSEPESESQREGDLLPVAQQHSYGVNFAPLHGHQKDHYQVCSVSGHASQHKSHAEGHVKWSGHKGKGVSYWNYQHEAGKTPGDHHSSHTYHY